MDTLIISCEHGGNQIPPPYRPLFRGQQDLLDSHRGHDAGALVMATALAHAFRAPLAASTTSRLLIDLNRSIGHPRLFSSVTRTAPRETRTRIVEDHYRPHRRLVEEFVAGAASDGDRVIHIASHTFTAELHGKVRTADVGLLYDPARGGESRLCARWRTSLAATAPDLRVRRNYPYRGTADGLTAHLRRRFGQRTYLGIELEINQGIVLAGGRPWTALRRNLIESLRTAWDPPGRPVAPPSSR